MIERKVNPTAKVAVFAVAHATYWDQFEGPVSEVADKVNDAYLKANGQVHGVQSYGRVVDLMLIDFACHRKGKMVE